jgi:hypothetical protein
MEPCVSYSRTSNWAGSSKEPLKLTLNSSLSVKCTQNEIITATTSNNNNKKKKKKKKITRTRKMSRK